MPSSSGLTSRDTKSHEDYAPIWDPIGVKINVRGIVKSSLDKPKDR